MAGLIIALALAAPLTGSGAAATPDSFDPPSISTNAVVEIPDFTAQKPKAGPKVQRVHTPVTVPADISYQADVTAVVVTPPPPPPPPVIEPPVASQVTEARASRVSRAAAAPNGRIPADALCTLSWDSSSALRCDAADALEAAAAAGMPTVEMTDAYRSYDDQVAVKASRGSWAAQPGTSNHGYGVAIDVPEPARAWLHRYGATYSWVNPAWARTEKHEPWHFEFVG